MLIRMNVHTTSLTMMNDLMRGYEVNILVWIDIMRTIDMFRTEKQQKIIQSLERIKMGTNSDIVRDANGRVDHSLIASYGKHLKVLMDDGVIRVCGRIAENIPVYCLTYHVDGAQMKKEE